jgi:glycosyltransferase involved in cell wall biosynthesis
MSVIAPNVLLVTREMSGDRRYGLGRSLMPVVDALESRGWRVRYLCQEDLPALAKPNRQRWLNRFNQLPWIGTKVHLQHLMGALAERLQMGWFAAETARKDGFTAVHLHDPWLGMGFWLAARVMRLRHVRWGITEHGFGCYSRATHEDGLTQGPLLQRWLRRLEIATLGAAHWVLAPTQLALDQLARDLALPFNPSHWKVIAHAAPNVALTDKTLARAQLGWDLNGFHIIGVGRLVPLKRFDILVGACASLATRYPGLHLHLLGDGERSNLQQQADEAGFGDRVDFAVVDDVQPYLAAADAYASTSVTESFGLANFEALMAGLPCICTAVGGVPEVMGLGAWLIPVDQDALANAIEELICNPAQRQALSARALVQAALAPNLASVTEQYVQLYRQ